MVPPFAGLVHLSSMRTLVPMGVASAIWYGGITFARRGDRAPSGIGSCTIIAGVNRTLGVIAGVRRDRGGDLVSGSRRRRRKQERVWHATRDALEPAAPSFLEGSEIAEGSARRPRPCWSWSSLMPIRRSRRGDRELVAAHLRDRWGLERREATPPEPPPEDERRTRFAGYAAMAAGARSAARSGWRWWSGCGPRLSATGCHRRPRGSADAPGRPSSWASTERR